MTAMRKSERGFYQGEHMSDSAGGKARLAQSSRAVCEGDAVQSGYVWLFISDEFGPMNSASLHLSHEQARELAKRINAMVGECEASR